MTVDNKTFKNVAVAGSSGGLGFIVTKALMKDGNFRVRVLSRSETSPDRKKAVEELKSLGANVRTIDYTDVEDLKKALEGFDVIISTLGGPAIYKEQLNLIQAAKFANVKRFIPSEFGFDLNAIKDIPNPLFEAKRQVEKAVKESGLEYTFINNGFFTDTSFYPWLGFDIRNKTIKLVGNTDQPVALTHREDVAKYIIAMLKNAEISRNKTFMFATDNISFNQVVAIIKQKFGEDFKVEREPIEKAIERAKANNYQMETFGEQALIAAHQGLVGVKNPDNYKFEEVKPITVGQYFDSIKQQI